MTSFTGVRTATLMLATLTVFAVGCGDPNAAKEIAQVTDAQLAPPGSDLTSSHLQEETVVEDAQLERRYVVSLTPAETVAFYERELAEKNWVVRSENATGGLIYMSWTRDEFQFRIIVDNSAPTSRSTDLTVVVSKKEQSK